LGLRFRRSIKILPGVRLNFSKSGVSTSLGGPGASINLGPKGTRQTIGLPGTGISYSTFTPKGGGTQNASPPVRRPGATWGCGFVAASAILLLAVGKCASGSSGIEPASTVQNGGEVTYAVPSGAAAKYSEGETVTVTSSSLRTRSTPSANGVITGALHKGETTTVVSRSGEWLQVAQGAGLAWIAASHVRQAHSQSSGLMSSSPNLQSSESKKRHSIKSGGSESNADCPCRGSRVCIGPRGGRYCITSGGRKRYGV